MKLKLLWLFLFVLSIQLSKAQNENFELVQDVYKQWHRFAFNDRNQCKKIYINDSIESASISCIKERITEIKKLYRKDAETNKIDSIEFDDTEIRYIIDRANKLNDNHWSENIFPNARIIYPSEFEKHFNTIGYLDPIEKLCYNIYTFSNPIFLRNNTLCFFYSEEKTFSNLNGEFSLYIYKNKNWMLYSTICRNREVRYGANKTEN